MILTAKNGKTFHQVVFHLGPYEWNAYKAVASKGDITVLDGGKTLVVSNIYSDNLTLSSPTDDYIYVLSVDVTYRGGGGFENYVTLDTERNDPDCYGRKTAYTYRGHEYTQVFENSAAPVHNFRYDFGWELGEEETINVTDSRTGEQVGHTVKHPVAANVTRTCLDCGLVENASSVQAQDVQLASATYTEDGAITFPVTAQFADGTVKKDSYVYVLPKHELVHYPSVAPSCEQYGFSEVWYDEETHQCYSDAAGTQFIRNTNDHLTTIMFNNGKLVNYDCLYADNPDFGEFFGYHHYAYVSRSASGDLTISTLTAEMRDNMTGITDMPADFVNIDINDVWSLSIPTDGDVIVIFSNEENPAQVSPVPPLGHHYDPETEIIWDWSLVEREIYLNDCPVSTKAMVPDVTALFVCDRCGETIAVDEENVMAEMISGTTPSFDEDGHMIMKARAHLRHYGYNEEIESPEKEIVVPKYERAYQKVEAKEATFTEEGNIEYYLCSDGKGYAKDGDTYTQLPDGSWIIPPLGSESIDTNTWDGTRSGNFATVSGSAGGGDGMYVENQEGTPTNTITVTAKSGYKLDKVVFHVGYGEDRSEYGYVDKGQFSLSDDHRTITVTNIDAKTLTLYTNFCDWDHMDPGEPDPDMPDWEPMQGVTSFQVNRVDIYFVLTG